MIVYKEKEEIINLSAHNVKNSRVLLEVTTLYSNNIRNYKLLKRNACMKGSFTVFYCSTLTKKCYVILYASLFIHTRV